MEEVMRNCFGEVKRQWSGSGRNEGGREKKRIKLVVMDEVGGLEDEETLTQDGGLRGTVQEVWVRMEMKT